jgi:DNA polymerase III subunit delta'
MPLRDLTGHRRIVELLARSIDRGTLPPTLLFAGPSGAGTRQTAFAVAQTLNCTNRARNPIDACGTCAACVRIARGVHPDVLVVEPGDSGAIKIDQVREVVDRAAFRPFEGRRRVVIFDEADALVVPAQNALLKTLEEPPPSTVFILTTSRPDTLLPTVRSRCIRLSFAAAGPIEVDADAREVASQVLAQIASLDPSPTQEREGFSRADAFGRAAPKPDGRRLDAAKTLLTGTGGSAADDRQQVAAHLRAMASLLRDIEAVHARADAAVLANADVRPAIERLVPTYRGMRGVEACAAIDRALAAIDANAGIKVVADWLVLQL